MEDFLNEAGNMAMLYGVKIVTALIIFVIGRWVAGKFKLLLQKVMIRREVDVAVTGFISSLCYYALLSVVVIAALSQLGLQTTSLVAIIGAAGLAVGLALQGSLSNFAAGVLILIFRPFRVGDYVELAGTSGTVKKIQIFTTELSTPDNKQVIIPNSAAMGGIITNYSINDTRRVDLIFGISYSDDIDKARDILKEIVASDSRVLSEPETTIAVKDLGDSSVNFVVRPWVKTADYWDVYFDITEAVKKRFDAENVSIPFPQRDVHVYQHGGE